MIALTIAEISAAVDGKTVIPAGISATPETVVSGEVQTDSREITPGGIFVARRGEATDGHLFAEKAHELGAALLIVERELDVPLPQIIVADATIALSDLAREVVARVHALGQLQVVAITGSNGKTTTKNLVAAMAAKLGPTVASEKSFNNEVGAPLTMLRITEDTRFLITEMGANAPGDIAKLVNVAKPDIGVVLMVGMAHAGGFGGIAVTAKSKAEMVTSLPPTAIAVLNGDDPRVAAMAEETDAEVRYFGSGQRVSATDIETGSFGSTFNLVIGEKQQPVRFKVLGEHHIANALAAATVADALGLSLETIVETLEETVKPARWRMEVTRCRNNITVINDAYNANPDSMAAALKTLAQIADPHGRTIAVLGEMSELGEYAGEEHDRVALLAVRLRIDQVVIVGENIRRMYISSINEGVWDEQEAHYFTDQDSALAYLSEQVRQNDTVLIKSSNAAGLRFLGDKLGEALA